MLKRTGISRVRRQTRADVRSKSASKVGPKSGSDVKPVSEVFSDFDFSDINLNLNGNQSTKSFKSTKSVIIDNNQKNGSIDGQQASEVFSDFDLSDICVDLKANPNNKSFKSTKNVLKVNQKSGSTDGQQVSNLFADFDFSDINIELNANSDNKSFKSTKSVLTEGLNSFHNDLLDSFDANQHLPQECITETAVTGVADIVEDNVFDNDMDIEGNDTHDVFSNELDIDFDKVFDTKDNVIENVINNEIDIEFDKDFDTKDNVIENVINNEIDIEFDKDFDTEDTDNPNVILNELDIELDKEFDNDLDDEILNAMTPEVKNSDNDQNSKDKDKTCDGFQTVSGKAFEISESDRKKAIVLFKDIEEWLLKEIIENKKLKDLDFDDETTYSQIFILSSVKSGHKKAFEFKGDKCRTPLKALQKPQTNCNKRNELISEPFADQLASEWESMKTSYKFAPITIGPKDMLNMTAKRFTPMTSTPNTSSVKRKIDFLPKNGISFADNLNDL